MTSVYVAAGYVFLALLLLKVGQRLIHDVRLRKVMPPGPPGIPLLGNLFQVTTFQWLQFTAWKEEYGESSFALSRKCES